MAEKEKKSNPKTDAMRAVREARYAEAHEKPVRKPVKKPAKSSFPAKPTSTDKP